MSELRRLHASHVYVAGDPERGRLGGGPRDSRGTGHLTAVRHRIIGALVIFVLLAACSAAPRPSASPQPASPDATSSIAAVSLPPTATPTAAPTQLIDVPATARPYTPAEVLAAMRESRRPGGVPDQLETEAVANAVAAAIWTYDGLPYPVLVIGGSCGLDRCTLELSGTPTGAAGSDLYAFSVVAGTGATELLESDLHGYPAQLDTVLDDVAREQLDADTLTGLALTGATWLPPPETGVFRALYRSGGGEGSPGIDLVIDLLVGSVLESIPR